MCERSDAKIHAVSAITRECRRQEGRIYVAECNAVGGAEAAVDGHAHDGGACRVHVKRKADKVAQGTFTTETSLDCPFVALLQPNAVDGPRSSIVAGAFILARLEPLCTNAQLNDSKNMHDMDLKVKTAT